MIAMIMSVCKVHTFLFVIKNGNESMVCGKSSGIIHPVS